MKLSQLKRLLIIRSIIFLLLLVGMIALYMFVDDQSQTKTQTVNLLQGEVNDLNSKVANLKKKSQEIIEAKKLWERLNDKHKKSEGLKIDSMKLLVDDYKKQFKLASADLDLSSPVELSDIYKTETTVVVSSKVMVKFKGISDEYLLSFVDAMIKNLPGYVKVEKLVLSRTGEITNDALVRISNGETPELVNGEMAFLWRDLKDIAVKPANSAPPTEVIKPPL